MRSSPCSPPHHPTLHLHRGFLLRHIDADSVSSDALNSLQLLASLPSPSPALVTHLTIAAFLMASAFDFEGEVIQGGSGCGCDGGTDVGVGMGAGAEEPSWRWVAMVCRRVIHQTWRRSIETISRYFREVLYAIGELRDEMIKPPTANEIPLKDCIGVIDGTHVHARVPAKIAAAFRGRKHYTTQNVLAAVDFDLKFTYVLAGWEGSAHDALILADAIEREDGLRVPPVIPDEVTWEPSTSDSLPNENALVTDNAAWGSLRDGIAISVRTDKGFKEVHLNQVAKALQEFSGIEAHPKDAEYLNRPIENYKEMMTIFGTGLATGKWAMGSNEALGTTFSDASSVMKSESFDEGDKAARAIDEMAKAMGDSMTSREGREVPSAGADRKRKRAAFTDDDTVALNNMTDAVKDVATAIRETKVELLNPDLNGAVMYQPGFTEEALICAFSHLVDNRAQGDAFVTMTESHRVLWLRTWLSKHYYM
ncbi:hypothetical protein QOZ80_9BG0706670 [Eleusine coracana subsp. coracana]|nr:hypothetical protein QOZ80_9BG0706670 [Eleusine coracana subsp. coracana]